MAGESENTTFTQEQVDAMVAERIALETEGLKKSQQQLLKEAKDAKARAAAFEGLDPTEARSWKEKLLEMEQTAAAQKAGITSETLAKMRAEAQAELEKRYGPIVSERDALKGEVRSLRLDTKVKEQMGKAGVRSDRIDALYKLAAGSFDLTEDGDPMVKGAVKEIDKFITEDLLKEYPEFFNGSGSSGGGATKSTGGAGGVRVIAAGSKWSSQDIMDLATGKARIP